MIVKNSPNQNERKDGMKPFMLILHYTGTQNAAEADAIYGAPDKVSPHYMIDVDGSVTQYVEENKRAWHAGLSSWDAHKDINSASIGIEVVNGGHAHALPAFPEIQIQNLIGLIKGIRSRWAIPDYYILGHSDVAPGRKVDPGEHFPWQELHRMGIGLMPDQEGITPVRSLSESLKSFGYDYTNNLAVLKDEFCRHYLPLQFGRASEGAIMQAVQSILEQKEKVLSA